MGDQPAEQLSARTRELMAESGLSWRQAWLQAEDELGRPRSGNITSSLSTVRWMAAGLALSLVPGIVSQIVRPGWLTTPSSHDGAVGGAAYLGLLALSGLGIAAIGLRFGLMGRSKEGRAAVARMYLGVVVGA
jgi:hypothetical protein